MLMQHGVKKTVRHIRFMPFASIFIRGFRRLPVVPDRKIQLIFPIRSVTEYEISRIIGLANRIVNNSGKMSTVIAIEILLELGLFYAEA